MPDIFEGPLRSKLSIFDLATKSVEVIYEADGITEAPNWSKDGRFLLVNSNGQLFRIWLDAPEIPEHIDLGPGGFNCNNDHDFSPDGSLIAFSAGTDEDYRSQVFVANADGTAARRVSPESTSYFHGWSSDGKSLAYVAGRRGRDFELYSVSVDGGEETQLTSAGGYDDGPDYSPDGQWIYFNSNRSGAFHLYRMPTSGGGTNDTLVEQVTNDAPEDWFPHISPDGTRMVSVAFPAGTEGHNDRMPGMALRLAATPGESPEAADIRTILTFDGGQGSLNVNSWSPDSSKFAFVQFVPTNP